MKAGCIHWRAMRGGLGGGVLRIHRWDQPGLRGGTAEVGPRDLGLPCTRPGSDSRMSGVTLHSPGKNSPGRRGWPPRCLAAQVSGETVQPLLHDEQEPAAQSGQVTCPRSQSRSSRAGARQWLLTPRHPPQHCGALGALEAGPIPFLGPYTSL